jgi:hypothetical protein
MIDNGNVLKIQRYSTGYKEKEETKRIRVYIR